MQQLSTHAPAKSDAEITVVTSDVDRLLAFYVHTLDATIVSYHVENGTRHAVVSLGDGDVPRLRAFEPRATGHRSRTFGADTLDGVRLTVAMSTFEQLREAVARALGGVVVIDHNGTMRFHFVDFEGTVYEVRHDRLDAGGANKHDHHHGWLFGASALV